MQIREIQMDDAEAFLLLQKKLDEETSYMLLEPGERNTEVAGILKRIQDVMAQENRTIRVVEVNGELVGYIELVGGNVHRNRHTAYIVVGIRSNNRGMGLGTQLFTKGEAWARCHGIHRLELTVMVHNHAAIALYKKMGFHIEGTKRHSLKVDGQYVDEYYMAKLLD